MTQQEMRELKGGDRVYLPEYDELGTVDVPGLHGVWIRRGGQQLFFRWDECNKLEQEKWKKSRNLG